MADKKKTRKQGSRIIVFQGQEDILEILELMKGADEAQKAQIKGVLVGMQLTTK